MLEIGSYSDLPLAAARQAAKDLRAKIAVGPLADEYFERMINGHWKHPNIARSRIEKDIKPHLGKLALDAVEPRPTTWQTQAARSRPASERCHATRW